MVTGRRKWRCLFGKDFAITFNHNNNKNAEISKQILCVKHPS